MNTNNYFYSYFCILVHLIWYLFRHAAHVRNILMARFSRREERHIWRALPVPERQLRSLQKGIMMNKKLVSPCTCIEKWTIITFAFWSFKLFPLNPLFPQVFMLFLNFFAFFLGWIIRTLPLPLHKNFNKK